MSRALLSFIGGMGSGYLSQTDKNKDRARQERLDAQNQQLFDARMAQTKLQTSALTRAEKTAQAQSEALDSMNQYAEGNEATGEVKRSFQDATGLSKDSTALLASSEGGYGGGTTGLQAAAGDVALESRRMRPAAPEGDEPPATPVLPTEAPAAAAQDAGAPVTAAAQAAAPATAPAAISTPKPVFSSSVGGMAAAAGAYTEKGLLERQKKYHLLAGDMNSANATQEKIKTLTERDADVSAYGRIGKMTNAQLFSEFGQHFNENRNLDGDLSLDAATGKLYLKPYEAGKPAFEVPRSALEQAAFTVHRIGRGDVAAGMATLGALDKDQRQLISGYSTQRMAIAKAIGDQAEGAAKTGYYNALAGKNDALAASGGAAPRAPLVERMSESDKMTRADLIKQKDRIQTQLVKMESEGSLDEANTGAKRLRTELGKLNLLERQLITKYEGADPVATPDPLGMRKPAPSGKAVTAPNPFNAGKQGQVDILNQEMRLATESLSKPGITPDERMRAQTDIGSLTKELKNLGVTVR